MRIPRYWRKVEAETPRGGRVAAWGWSSDDPAEAERVARDRLTLVLDRLHRGEELPPGYAYGKRPLREQILEEIADGDGELRAVLTRNGYGAVVINAARVMFVDVDLPIATLGQRVARLFGSGRSPEEATLQRIRDTLQGTWGSFRIYRTAAGFRVLATDPLYEPGSPQAHELMQHLGADEAFIHLCRVQESFRARLTPKPWRCGLRNPPGRFPRDLDEETAFSAWRVEYEQCLASKSTCRFVEAIGRGATHSEARTVVDIHDRWTKAGTSLPLA